MRQDSPSNAPGGAQIIQTGFSERWLIVLLILVAFSSLILAALALHESGQAFATASAEVAALRETVRSSSEATAAIVKTNNGKIEVLQYDHNALKAQLVAKGLYQATEH